LTDLAAAALDWVHRQQDQAIKYDQMTIRQIAILGIIASDSPIDFGEVSSRLGLTKPVATRAIHTLRLLGLVSQSSAPDDRRRRIVTITPLGSSFRRSLYLGA
jgi:DNA-binding MarR family transcriptional regulator